MLHLAPKKNTAKTAEKMVPALRLQTSPPVYIIVISGRWLLEHTTTSWRSEDRLKGFQRIVNKDRAKQIARTVLDRDRAFPNAITLATNLKDFKRSDNEVALPERAKFLVVDGQHRLWAQNYSEKDGQYACIIHLNKTEQEMAELFLEINDNQRRVPSSLRWDLVRLVRPKEDESALTAAELVFELSIRKDSPFYISIDLTGEQKDVSIKQGSLAPEIKTLVGRIKKVLDPTFDQYTTLLIRFFSAIRSLNPQGWGDPNSTFYKARVLRALLRVLVDIAENAKSLDELTADFLLQKLQKINPATLSEEKVRNAQGAVGVINLYREMKKQVFQ